MGASDCPSHSKPCQSSNIGSETASALRTSLFLRSLVLMRLAINVSAGFAKHRASRHPTESNSERERLRENLVAQARLIAQELGQLKGSVMKVGQMISVYGERFLPPEANAVLKTLQAQAPPLEWSLIAPVIERELGADAFEKLDFDTKAVASASLGQVHSAIDRRTGERLAVKVQYPGVDRAVFSDLKALQTAVTLARFIPNLPQFSCIMTELKDMLSQELDYRHEAGFQESFRTVLADDPRYVVPRVHGDLSTSKILTSTYIDGLDIDAPEISALSQDRRDAIGLGALELYFREIFELNMVQTDSHFGNYRLQLAQHGGERDRLVLFDFGAVRRFAPSFTEKYRLLTIAALKGSRRELHDAAMSIGFLKAEDPPQLVDAFAEFCFMVVEPFAPQWVQPEGLRYLSDDGTYDWGASDLPERLARQLGHVIDAYQFRAPPREIIFLDRKISGLFIFMSKLRSCAKSGSLLREKLKG